MEKKQAGSSPKTNREPEHQGDTPSGQGVRPASIQVPWRRSLVAALVANGIFFVFFVLSGAEPRLIFASSIVFLPLGIWVGRKSESPLRDGAIFGLLSALLLTLILLVQGFSMGGWSLLYALFLALPQGLLGAYLGRRVPFLRERRHEHPPNE